MKLLSPLVPVEGHPGWLTYKYGHSGTEAEKGMPVCAKHGIIQDAAMDLGPAAQTELRYQVVYLPAETCTDCAALGKWLRAKPDVSLG